MVINNEKMSKFFSGIYLWMFIGLLVSGGVAYYTSISKEMIRIVYSSYVWIILLEFIIVIVFNALRKKVSSTGAKVLFITYSAVSGLTLSSIFLVYKIQSIVTFFLAAALMFGLLALYGYTTKQDLSSMGRILIFALIAIVVMSLINIFINNSSFGIVVSIISIVIFLGLTAWDMQSLKSIYAYYQNDQEELNKMTVYGALDLYLDFINIFLQLLNLFGKNND